MRKERADQLVFQQGLASSREQAKRLIMAGEIYVLQEPTKQPQEVDKPGHAYPPETQFFLRKAEQYVSRGAYKLLTLIQHASLDVSGCICLDAGASTGGFTDCLLQHGAARVYAVDVGHNQLHEKLRNDPRVVSLEGINLRHPQEDLISEPVDLITADVSFISLTLILPPCMQWLKNDGNVAVLIKPQFELSPKECSKGVVRDPAARQRAVDKIISFANDTLHLSLQYLIPSAIKGPKGNQEYMALFTHKDINSATL